jgi:hypothetical protein
VIALHNNPNHDFLLSAVQKLEPLLDRLAFVGGCATGLLVSDPAAAPVRVTIDIDVIVELTSDLGSAPSASYAELVKLEEHLRQLGFRESQEEDAPRCRWLSGKVVLDVMPTDPAVLGFSNRWYRPALENAQWATVGEFRIRLITSPYFLATKLEAFHGRGSNDLRMSHDLEDIISVIDGRAELVDEISASPPELRQYLGAEFQALLSDPAFSDALPGHLLPDAASQERAPTIIARMRQIADAH